jgi:hypothetical protein
MILINACDIDSIAVMGNAVNGKRLIVSTATIAAAPKSGGI